MHDTTRLENEGIPAVPVATTEFRTAARVQAGRLGRPDFDAVYVEHPIQDQTPEEIQARADAVVGELVEDVSPLRICRRLAAARIELALSPDALGKRVSGWLQNRLGDEDHPRLRLAPPIGHGSVNRSLTATFDGRELDRQQLRHARFTHLDLDRCWRQ